MSTSNDYRLILCDESGCEDSIRNHRWGKTRSGWFFGKSGTDYCPAHIPDWVEEWRKKKVES